MATRVISRAGGSVSYGCTTFYKWISAIHCAPLEREIGGIHFYKHIAPLERRVEHLTLRGNGDLSHHSSNLLTTFTGLPVFADSTPAAKAETVFRAFSHINNWLCVPPNHASQRNEKTSFLNCVSVLCYNFFCVRPSGWWIRFFQIVPSVP